MWCRSCSLRIPKRAVAFASLPPLTTHNQGAAQNPDSARLLDSMVPQGHGQGQGQGQGAASDGFPRLGTLFTQEVRFPLSSSSPFSRQAERGPLRPGCAARSVSCPLRARTRARVSCAELLYPFLHPGAAGAPRGGPRCPLPGQSAAVHRHWAEVQDGRGERPPSSQKSPLRLSVSVSLSRSLVPTTVEGPPALLRSCSSGSVPYLSRVF